MSTYVMMMFFDSENSVSIRRGGEVRARRDVVGAPRAKRKAIAMQIGQCPCVYVGAGLSVNISHISLAASFLLHFSRFQLVSY